MKRHPAPVPRRRAEAVSPGGGYFASGLPTETAEGPETYPLAADVLVSDAGRVWLRLGYPDDGPRTWWILGPDGEIGANVDVPAGVRLAAVGEGVAWGVLTDELDVPYVIRYDVRQEDDG